VLQGRLSLIVSRSQVFCAGWAVNWNTAGVHCMNLKLKKPRDLLILSRGDSVTKGNLFDLIQYSKVDGSPYWDGFENKIGNTPQQGINWLGQNPNCSAVLIKTRPGLYDQDGWIDEGECLYRYSIKSVKGHVSYAEKANAVLINQPANGFQFCCLLNPVINGFIKVPSE